MSKVQTKSHKGACPDCGSPSGMRNQSFCSDCGYHPVAKQRFEGVEEQVRGPAMIGMIIVMSGVVLLGLAGALGRIYIWDSGEHRFWMRYLLIVGGAAFLLGHLAAFWYSLVKTGIDFSDIFNPKSVWGPVLYDMHKKWIVTSMGAYGLVTMLAALGLFGVNYESYLGKKSNRSVWKMISDIQVALGKEPTAMPEISFEKLQGDFEVPTGGDGKLVIDTDLSVLDPTKLEALAEVLGEGKNHSNSGEEGSFEELSESMDVSLLAEGAKSEKASRTDVKEAFEKVGGSLGGEVGTHSGKRTARQRPLKYNQLECFIFGYTVDENGDLENLVLGTVKEGVPSYVGLMPSRLIRQHHYEGVSLEFFKNTAETPFAECELEAKWLTPKAICVIEHQGTDYKGEYVINRFIRFNEIL